MAFLDTTPAADGHTLVIPKRHVADLLAASEADAVAVARTTHQVAALVQRRMVPDGITVFQANRTAGWQTVLHLHVHIIPRWSGDDLTPPWVAAHPGAAPLSEIRARLCPPD
jgi:histidine triad (HIT) family protein